MTDAFANASPLISRPRSAATVAVDNFLRKALRVSDPRDPSQIANALLARYPEEAERDRRERAGLPYSNMPDFLPVVPSAGAQSTEIVQALDDLERDLQTLSTASQLKSIRVEMIGWGRAVRQIATEGLASAKLALDTVNQDRAMTARRKLTDYARLARYVGSLTEGSGLYFRRFARSCDVLAGLVLVAIGEGLAANGITRSTKMVRVAASELHSRREAVLRALNGLIGVVDIGNGLPRGVAAYGQLLAALEGRPELSTLLEENGLAAAMDNLVEFSTGGSVESLRELASISALPISQFQELIAIASAIVENPDAQGIDSPPLINFITNLGLFVDAFVGRDNARLLHIARPAILSGGLYDIAGSEGATRLRDLANDRGALITQVENRAGCGCDFAAVSSEVMLDFILSQVDRAIDLTASGTDVRGQGKAEMRAAAVGLVIEGALRITDSSGEFYFDFEPALETVLNTIAARLTDPFRQNGVWPAEVETLVIQELLSNSATEDRTETLVRSLSPGAHGQLFNLAAEDVVIPSQIELVARSRRSLIRSMIAEVLRVDFEIGVDGTPRFGLVPTLERTVYGTLPRIADSIESIEDHVINGPNGGGSGPGPAPAPGGGGTDPENPNINPHNINAFYGAVVGPGGGFTRDSGCASWMRQVLKNGGITNPQSLSDLARYLADVPEQERREKFVGEMLAAAQDFAGLPQKLNADELAAIFDGALAVYDRLTNT